MRALPLLARLLAICLIAGLSSAVRAEPAERLEPTMLLIDQIVTLETQLDQNRAARAAAQDTLELMRLTEEGAALGDEIAARRLDLDRLATGLDAAELDQNADLEIVWDDELQELLAPILQELKLATVRPRAVERRRRQITRIDESLPRIEQGVAEVEALLAAADSPWALAELGAIRESWMRRASALRDQRAIAALDLERLEREGQGVFDTAGAVASQFYRRRGRNLLLSLAAFAAVLFGVRLLRRGVMHAFERMDRRRDSLALRITELLIHLAGSIGAAVAMLLVLYASGDWVLLTLATVIFLGLLWGARQGLPRFWRELQLLLNVGPVRQGERMIWEGLPWRVRSLHLITLLDNPALPGARIRLPLRALHDRVSRPALDGEPWFPSQVGDWVLLDGRRGQVMNQGPDFVRVRIDASDHLLPVADYLAARPINLSAGFLHRVSVGLDRRHMGAITAQIPRILRERAAAAIAARPGGEHLEAVVADFDGFDPRTGALMVEIEARFDGAAAAEWERLLEAIWGAALEACAAEGWELAAPRLGLMRARGEE